MPSAHQSSASAAGRRRPPVLDANPASLADGPLLTVEQVAAHLNVPKRWVYERVQRQEITAVRLGRRLRFAPSAINSYIRYCSDNTR